MEPKILLLGVISVFSAGVGTLTVIQDPPFINLSAGDTARMSCDVRNVTAGEIEHQYWHRYINGLRSPLENPSRVTITQNSLIISSVTPKDTGLYICSVRDKYLHPYSGNETYMSVTASPVVTLVEDTQHDLLICRAERFYPQDLDIYWSISLSTDQVKEELTENQDGTFTKMSKLTLTKTMQGQMVACNVNHTTLSTTPYRNGERTIKAIVVSHTDPRILLYQQLFPVRVLLLIILLLSPVFFHVYHHLQE
ncbi:tyrosine-protein phosphatase non-receptor type substrate 1-like [Aquarana catesbeiana]|uniref:tyrosine-protein phosphatase non-receptor type substrate 1-like n=1 Tax=Aquarana catesbeiana TaxID=8400 RepID=UPI003CC92ACE